MQADKFVLRTSGLLIVKKFFLMLDIFEFGFW